jgi:hypothetical protein
MDMQSPVTWQFLSLLGGGIFTVIGTTAFLTVWITQQFSVNRAVFYRLLSLHNKEDDDRFAELKEDIWSLHIRNARKDGEAPPVQRHFPRRRYLQEDREGSDN